MVLCHHFLGATTLTIPKADVTKSNSTSLLVTITSLPTVPPDDQWTSIQIYDIVYYRSVDASTKNVLSLNGSLPISKNITGLHKYTDYKIYLHYYGRMKSTIEHNIISGETQEKTDEDGKFNFQVLKYQHPNRLRYVLRS